MAYGPRRTPPTKLDPYRPIIETRIAACPALSAVRILEEIRAAGTPAATRSSKRWCGSSARRRPVSRVRFETPAGRQAQPRERSERDERRLLLPLPPRRSTSLVLDAPAVAPTAAPRLRPVPPAEKRALTVYAQLAGGGA